MKALFISAQGYEDIELFYPFYRLKEAGLEVDLASVETGPLKGIHGYQIQANFQVSGMEASNYGILVLPGGRAPQTLRNNENVLTLVKKFFTQEKLVAAICHGPQVLISAGLVGGRRMTAYKKVQPELSTAGAIVIDDPVVIDGRLITSREPVDLPLFGREIIKALGL